VWQQHAETSAQPPEGEEGAPDEGEGDDEDGAGGVDLDALFDESPAFKDENEGESEMEKSASRLEELCQQTL